MTSTQIGCARCSTDPMGKVFFNILATFAEFGPDLIRMRTREGFNAMKTGRLSVIDNAPQPALRLIATFLRRFPDIDVRFSLYDWSTATQMTRNRLADIALITEPPESDIWEQIPIESV